MRKHKYRAWINKLGCWAQSVVVITVGDAWGYVAYDEQNVPYYDCELEEYTGLKDKNGTEIYEGDIYLSTYHSRGAGNVGDRQERVRRVVEWWQENGSWFGKRIETGRGYNRCHPRNELGESPEVIGNIRENPELLKGEQK